MRERMKVRRRQQWPSKLNPWLFLKVDVDDVDDIDDDDDDEGHLHSPIEMCL